MMKIGDDEDDGDNDDVDDEEDVNGYEDTEDGVDGNIEKCQGDGENMRVVVKIVIVKGNLEIPTIAHPQNSQVQPRRPKQTQAFQVAISLLI